MLGGFKALRTIHQSAADPHPWFFNLMLNTLFGINKHLLQVNKCMEGAGLGTILKASGPDIAGGEPEGT